MKPTPKFGFTLDSTCLTVGKGCLEAAIKHGNASVFGLMSIFDKNYDNHTIFAKRLYDKVWMNNSKKPERIILNIAFAPWSQMTTEQKAMVPLKYSSAAEFSNRFYPLDMDNYLLFLQDHITAIKKYPEMFNAITYDIGHEPNAPRYWWDSFLKWKKFTFFKIAELEVNGIRKVLLPHTTTSLLIDPMKYKSQYLDFINKDMIFDQATPLQIGFSTSMYLNSSAGKYEYSNNEFPVRYFNEIVFAECGPYSSMNTKGALNFFNNMREMMIYFIGLIQYAYQVRASTVLLHTLYDCSDIDKKGQMGYWVYKTSGVYEMKPAFKVYLDIMSVIKNGWEEIPGGIKGTERHILISETSYIIQTN